MIYTYIYIYIYGSLWKPPGNAATENSALWTCFGQTFGLLRILRPFTIFWKSNQNQISLKIMWSCVFDVFLGMLSQLVDTIWTDWYCMWLAGAGGRAQNSLQYICIPHLPPPSLL